MAVVLCCAVFCVVFGAVFYIPYARRSWKLHVSLNIPHAKCLNTVPLCLCCSGVLKEYCLFWPHAFFQVFHVTASLQSTGELAMIVSNS